jgi:flavorubredoxin
VSSITLFNDGTHSNVQLEDYGHGEMVQANQHLIIHGESAMLLDPGGHKVYARAVAETGALVGIGKLRYIFCSHQDPDIVAALNGWLMTTDAEALAPAVWTRFIPHFGVDKLVLHRLRAIPDEGMVLSLGDAQVMLIPAHFLHSCGNFQVYDAHSKILYTGDLGASLGMDYYEVSDFDAHIQYMEGFHQRYMTSNVMLQSWAAMVRQLDIETIAPQHGAYFKGKAMCTQFINWIAQLTCGVDLMAAKLRLPTG